MDLIAGILRPDAGTIGIAERVMPARDEGVRDRLRAECVGYVFPSNRLD